jgi:plasmid stabilization system protein ParE
MPYSYTKSKLAEKDINHITKRSMADFGEAQTDKYLEGLAETLINISMNPKLGRIFIHVETQQPYLY